MKSSMNDRNARAQENMAASQAAGQIGAAREQATGNTLSTLWQQPAQFGGILGGMFGAYGSGLSGLGQSYGGNYSAYAQGLSNLGQMSAQERSNLYGSNAMAEAARQGAVANIGSAALGAYGGASNAALNAFAAQQDAYNRAMADSIAANQAALSTYGQSQNNAIGGIGQARNSAIGQLGAARSGALAQAAATYGGLGNAASQLGAAGLAASRQDRESSTTDQLSQQQSSSRDRSTVNERAGSAGNSYGSQDSNVSADFGGGGGLGGGGGFYAEGPSGGIASGSYGNASPYGGLSGGSSGGSTARSGSSQNSYGSSQKVNDIASDQSSMQRNRVRSDSYGGPSMPAFRESLGAGASGIAGALYGLADTRDDIMSDMDLNALNNDAAIGAVLSNPTGQSIASGATDGFNRLDAANNYARMVPSMMLDQTLSGLYGLGGQGYANSNRGMDQYYSSTNSVAESSPISQLLAGLSLGYGDVQARTGGLQRGLTDAYGSSVGNINDIYDNSIGNWMRGQRDARNALMPIADGAAQIRAQEAETIARERMVAAKLARQKAASQGPPSFAPGYKYVGPPPAQGRGSEYYVPAQWTLRNGAWSAA